MLPDRTPFEQARDFVTLYMTSPNERANIQPNKGEDADKWPAVVNGVFFARRRTLGGPQLFASPDGKKEFQIMSTEQFRGLFGITE